MKRPWAGVGPWFLFFVLLCAGICGCRSVSYDFDDATWEVNPDQDDDSDWESNPDQDDDSSDDDSCEPINRGVPGHRSSPPRRLHGPG